MGAQGVQGEIRSSRRSQQRRKKEEKPIFPPTAGNGFSWQNTSGWNQKVPFRVPRGEDGEGGEGVKKRLLGSPLPRTSGDARMTRGRETSATGGALATKEPIIFTRFPRPWASLGSPARPARSRAPRSWVSEREKRRKPARKGEGKKNRGQLKSPLLFLRTLEDSSCEMRLASSARFVSSSRRAAERRGRRNDGLWMGDSGSLSLSLSSLMGSPDSLSIWQRARAHLLCSRLSSSCCRAARALPTLFLGTRLLKEVDREDAPRSFGASRPRP